MRNFIGRKEKLDRAKSTNGGNSRTNKENV